MQFKSLNYVYVAERTVRMNRKMTQAQLAEAVGVGVTHISHIETGNTVPSLQVMLDIINTLKCSADELLCLEVEKVQALHDNWLGEYLADCSTQERKLITDMVLALKSSLRSILINPIRPVVFFSAISPPLE